MLEFLAGVLVGALLFGARKAVATGVAVDERTVCQKIAAPVASKATPTEALLFVIGALVASVLAGRYGVAGLIGTFVGVVIAMAAIIASMVRGYKGRRT